MNQLFIYIEHFILQIPNDWVREPDTDIKAFPHLFVDGKYGLNHEPRAKKLTPVKFYSQRILNEDNMYAKDHEFLFMGQQHIEINALERQINMSMSHGSLEVTESDGTKLVPSNDAFNIFQSIPGTPAYWKAFRNECCARMEQLGPFHIFFTFSCAEMRWPSVIAEVFKVVKDGKLIVTYELDENEEWDGRWESITIDDRNLFPDEDDESGKIWNLPDFMDHYFKKEKIGMTDFLRNHFILITRIFDKRARDFLNLVMKAKGIENYCFRVEFQMRGLPHIHGVGWLKPEIIQDCLDENGLFREDAEGEILVIDLIDDWISCSLNTGDCALDQLVKEVNMHKHTKSCKKFDPDNCRFNFPRPPSNKTMISKPVDLLYPDMSGEEKEQKVTRAKVVMEVVKKTLNELKDNDDDCDDDLRKFLLEKCDYEKQENVDVVDEYHELLRISESGKTVVLKRNISERNVNNYNPTFQSIWNANTDIQLCLDSYAVVTYITDYLTKGDKNLTNHLKTALREKSDSNKFDQLNHIKKTYFYHKQTCVAEAAYRLIPGLNLKGSSVKSIFVSSGFPEKRHMYLHQVPDKDDDFMVNIIV